MMYKKKARLLVTCGDQLLAQHFKHLYQEKYEIRLLSTTPSEEEGVYYWCPWEQKMDVSALEGVEYILHLPCITYGPEIKSARRRYELYTSHTVAVSFLSNMLLDRGIRLKCFLVASSTDYYGNTYAPFIHTEEERAGADPLAQEYQALEETSQFLALDHLADRVAVVRLGRTFCHYDGILPHLTFGSECGWALYFGNGDQLIPWVHANDACRVFDWLLRHPEAEGVYNCVSPEWYSWKDISVSATYLRSGKVRLLHLPSLLLRVIREGLAESFLNSSRVSTNKLLEAGFDYQYPTLEGALLNIFDL